ncbi:MerR family DNA-binding transcriptional regulator [Rhodococcus sp. HNM0563]|uniref:MerR family transcriptional regulator n=1 Tax=Rhodococcus sp. HNM0563 TaxID=2716339 RepID=UPI00146ECAD1|nr:MerR family transcriptional regulator [Rhodococcus sp. HNM0563]NLU62949.1 MerR family DNA-binding transcriptional regulator [Rhodococcus sp. HNM0563]
MRIGELASAADTTVRTIRHYHRLGLLPEPPRSSNGYRVYSMEDLVRLMRIRWLAGAGVPLGTVPTVIGTARDSEASDDLTADLEALIADLDAQVHALDGKRRALSAMLDGHRRGETLSPLPEPLVKTFAELIDGETDPRTREVFEHERDSFELVALSGQAPPEFLEAVSMALSDPAQRESVVALYRRFGALAGHPPSGVAAEIDAVAEAMAEFLTAFGQDGEGGLFVEWVAAAATYVRDGESMMAEVLPDPAQRAVAIRVIARVAEGAVQS